MRLWIDTDVGDDPDDAVALLCAAAHPDIELVGVSTVDKDTGRRAEVARKLVDAPVVDGAQVELEMIRAAAPDAVLAIGPLTNVANLVTAGYRPPRLALMGGALRPVRHRRQMTTVEHNFGTAPGAAAAVVSGCAGALICPLDVTARMVLDDDTTARLVAAHDRLGPHIERWNDETGAPLCLHDPLALLALVDEPVVRVETVALVVEADGRLVESPDGVRHDVVLDVDVAAATARILALLDKRAR